MPWWEECMGACTGEQRGEMLCAGMFSADWPAWASPASPAGLRQMLERSEVLHTFTPPLPQMLS